MLVKWRQTGNRLIFKFELEDSDPSDGFTNSKGVRVSMGNPICYFEMPKNWRLKNTHPDLLAATAMMIIEPFVGETIHLPQPVSNELNQYFIKHFKKNLHPVDTTLKPRRASDKRPSVPALAFSGGVDSMTASLLMPRETVHIFVDRDSSSAHMPSMYDKSAAEHAISSMRKLGQSMIAIFSDYEYVRNPVGFSWGISSAAPAVLLADYLNIDCMAFGMILESAYGIGDSNFRKHGSRWMDLFNTIGLNYCLPTAGLSEVMTTKIVASSSNYKSLAQSCIRGRPGNPCRNCLKCFRKLLVEAAVQGNDLESLNLDEMAYRSKEIRNHILHTPIHHENIYSYALKGYRGSNEFLTALAKKVQADKIDVRWMDRWYGESAPLIYEKYRKEIISNIKNYTSRMSSQDASNLEAWNLKRLASENSIRGLLYRRRSQKFEKLITSKVS